jgi:hypothetical protein
VKILLLFTILTCSKMTFAGLADDYEKIKDLGRDLEPTGAICEEVARLRFAEKYPEPQFSVVTGIEYSDRDGTVGELDVVVFNNNTHAAQVIAEVKCWTNAKSGLMKAKEQRQRFLANVRSSKALKFKWLDDPKLPMTKTQFNKVSDFYFVAQAGTQADGFDYELPYSLRELMQLRKEILVCQSTGPCLKPK